MVRRSGETSQRSASRGVTLPSALILVSVSKTLSCTTSAMAAAAPVVGSSPGTGSSAMPSTKLSLRDWASTGRWAAAAREGSDRAKWRRFMDMGLLGRKRWRAW